MLQPSMIIADLRPQWGARGFHIWISLCLGWNFGNLCFLERTCFNVVPTENLLWSQLTVVTGLQPQVGSITGYQCLLRQDRTKSSAI